MSNNGHLSTVEAARLLGISPFTLRGAVKQGAIPAGGGVGPGFKFLREDVIAYWHGGMNGACVRCGILGEARLDLGLMCEPCEYEHRTGKIYRWPICPDRRPRAVLSGRLVLDGGYGGSPYP